MSGSEAMASESPGLSAGNERLQAITRHNGGGAS